MVGSFLASVVRVVNAPLRAVEKVVDNESKRDDEDNVLSLPGEKLAQALEEADSD